MIKTIPRLNSRTKMDMGATLAVGLCLIMTIYALHATGGKTRTIYPSDIICLMASSTERLDRLRAAYDVWGSQCYKVIILGNGLETASDIKNSNAIFVGNFVLDDYDHLIERIYQGFLLAYRIRGPWNWLLKADDDTFIHMDNLRQFLSTKSLSEPTAYGFYFTTHFSGGAGYVVNVAALRKLNLRYNRLPSCQIEGRLFWHEDLFMYRCLNESGIRMGETNVSQRQLFHPMSLNDYVIGKFPGWLYGMSKIPPQGGPNCCASDTISFHYVTPQDMYKIKGEIDSRNSTLSSPKMR